MNSEQLQRTLRLLRRTGDRGIVLDPGSDEIFILMDADSYEDLLDTTTTTVSPSPRTGWEEDDKTIEEDSTGDIALDDLIDLEERRGEPESSGAMPMQQVTKNTIRSVNSEFKKLDFSDVWPISRASAVLSEENLSDVPDDTEPEEEKFYLEPVE
jgi:hypothetical protein